MGTVGEDMADVVEGVVSGEDGVGVSGEARVAVRLVTIDKLEGKGIDTEINKGASP